MKDIFINIIFEKGEEIKGISSEIILNKNQKIREKQSNFWYDCFYIQEIKIALFEGISKNMQIYFNLCTFQD